MKKSKIIIIIIASVLTIVGIALCTLSFNDMYNSASKEKSLSIKNTEFNNIKINSSFCNVDVKYYPTAKNHNIALFHGNKDIACTIKNENDTLLIEINYTKSVTSYLLDFNNNITIYLPKKSYDNLQVKSTSGNVTVHSDLSFKSAEITSASGEIYMNAKSDDALSVKTSSGNIYLSDTTASKLKLTASSGNISIKNSAFITTYAKVISGNVKIANSSLGKSKLNVTSGNITFDKSALSNSVITAKSGNVTGTLNGSYTVMANSDSGNVNVPKTIGKYKLQITTGSGNIIINKK